MWVERKHKCDLPFEVWHDVATLDVWECDHCKREWEVVGISYGNLSEPSRLMFQFVSDCRDTMIRRGLEYPLRRN